MTSPILTVLVLAVLWLIVVVPMIIRSKDARAGERSVARFGRAMGALRRGPATTVAIADTIDNHQPEQSQRPPRADGVVPRRPVPASKESLMYPPDRNEMSEARRQMMARRRRSLTTLGGGSVLLFLIALLTGSTFVWLLEIAFLIGLGGYLFFLRSQARRDRERREARLQRASSRSVAPGYDATDERMRAERPVRTAESVVRIDEDDVDLDHLDTVDLTGLYSEVEFDDVQIRRAG